VHVIFVGKNPLLLFAGLRGWFLGTVDSRFRGNDSGVVGVINGETIANSPKDLPTILTGTPENVKFEKVLALRRKIYILFCLSRTRYASEDTSLNRY